MSEKRIIFGAPSISDAEVEEVVDTLRSGWIGTGPKVARFEREFAEYKTASHAVAVNSCTAALHLSLIVAGIGAGDEVITTPLTFCATVNAIIHVGAQPVLADVDPYTMNIDPAQIERKLTPRTKAIVPVHFAGLPCDMDAIGTIARAHDLKVIEDCAHAIETEFRGRPAGCIGDFGCFSFYPNKNITTGEGGVILTQSQSDAERLRSLALHGMSKDAWKRFSDPRFRHYAVSEIGYKCNMTDLNAAIGLHQLRRIDGFWRRRKEVWDAYDRAFADLPLVLPAGEAQQMKHARHLYTVLVDPERAGTDREGLIEALNRRLIGTGIHYLCLAEHPAYKRLFGWQAGDYPHATRIGRQTVSLPISPALSDGDVAAIISAVRECVAA
jgi:dTDP-4-amino-4,6-dideoxygalactose transaminase